MSSTLFNNKSPGGEVWNGDTNTPRRIFIMRKVHPSGCGRFQQGKAGALAKPRGVVNAWGSALTALLLWALSLAVQAQSPDVYHDHADQALQSFLLKFWNAPAQYFANQFPDNGSLTEYWTYANGWQAVIDGVERTGGEQYSGLIES